VSVRKQPDRKLQIGKGGLPTLRRPVQQRESMNEEKGSRREGFEKKIYKGALKEPLLSRGKENSSSITGEEGGSPVLRGVLKKHKAAPPQVEQPSLFKGGALNRRGVAAINQKANHPIKKEVSPNWGHAHELPGGRLCGREGGGASILSPKTLDNEISWRSSLSAGKRLPG